MDSDQGCAAGSMLDDKNHRLDKATTGAPARYVMATAVIMLLIALAAFYQMTQQPWIGARFVAAEHAEGIVVKKVHRSGSAAGVLSEGQRLTAISDGKNTVMLDPIILEEPNNLPTYALFNQSLKIQDDIWKILTQDEIQFLTNDGEWVKIEPDSSRPFSAIPVVFWFYPVMASMGVFLGILIWLRQARELQSTYILLLGWIFYLGMCEMMLIDREIALEYSYFKILLAGENFFTNGFVVFLLSIIFTYPSRILSPKQCLIFFGLAVLVVTNNTLQLIELPQHAFLFHFLFAHAAVVLALWLQWKKARTHPLNKAIILWVILWMAIPTLTALLIFVSPMILNQTSIVPIESARLIISLYSVGLAFGVLRYRLFDVERWWFLSLFWLMGGILVVAFDFIFVLLLNLQPANAITLSLVIAGLLYFPARQWLLTRMLPDRQFSIEEKITQVIAELSTSSQQRASYPEWKSIVKNYFNPAQMAPQPIPIQNASLTDSGLSLRVPGKSGDNGFIISGKNYGKKLFNQEDIQHIEALHSLTNMVEEASDAAEQAAKTERQRIMQDLHDTMGAQLLTLIHRSNGEAYAQDVRETLKNLRESVRILSKNESVSLSELLANWRTELREQADAHGFELNWALTELLDEDIAIPPHKALPIAFLTREVLLNLPITVEAKTVQIQLTSNLKSTYLFVTIQGDEQTSDLYRSNRDPLNRLSEYAQSIGHKIIMTPESGNQTERFRVTALVKLNR